ncbi:DUF3859 domain-containing protein [Novipirellula artificiosorum]|uniref:DUF3859 domain-containing protein n=1 Tax=Novipirellula artificiosorum TaxID=2528016 RepID=A0A5C6DXC1_9BACT|nr:DUF3859 domain-containing protein [Novipirellula artificiosorum]TWU40864.1 hypothetical protein Poly41_16990 [Novipirellula artificiosorum]
MAKRKPEIRMRSYGLYAHWDAESKELPRFLHCTTRVEAKLGVEFGFVIRVKGAKNQRLEYCIDHPGILDSEGKRRPPFGGSLYVKQNDWNFYLGDTVWEPVGDKLGAWRMFVELDGVVVAEKTFEVYSTP